MSRVPHPGEQPYRQPHEPLPNTPLPNTPQPNATPSGTMQPSTPPLARNPLAAAYRSRWYDNEAGPLVRPCAMTRGRTRPTGREFDLIALVVSDVPRPADFPDAPDAPVGPEQGLILDLCRGNALSVAEIAADLDLPLGVVRVLLGDLWRPAASGSAAPSHPHCSLTSASSRRSSMDSAHSDRPYADSLYGDGPPETGRQTGPRTGARTAGAGTGPRTRAPRTPPCSP